MSLATHLTPRIKLSRPRFVIEPLEARIAPAAVVSLDGLNGQNGFKIIGDKAYEFAGYRVSSAGDINGDGFDDIIVNAPYARDGDYIKTGSAYLVFGKAGGFKSAFHLDTLNGANGFKISPSEFSYNFDVTAGGDINGDGFDDLLIANSDGYDNWNLLAKVARGVTVLFGKGSGFVPMVDFSKISGSAGFQITKAFESSTSVPLATSVGDFNGDGFDDILIRDVDGYSDADFGTHVVFGKASFGSSVNLSTLDGSNGFEITARKIDRYFAGGGIGDFNGDGLADIAIAQSSANDYQGATFVIFGRAVEAGPSFDVRALDGSNGFTILGGADSGVITKVNKVEDFNGDGLSDMFVSVYHPYGSASDSAGFLILGKSGTHEASTPLSNEKAFTFSGGLSGYGPISAGDINGDGLTDLLVPAVSISRTGTPEGQKTGICIVYGNEHPSALVVDALSPSAGNGGFHISLGTADVNGDGFDDIIVGTPYGGKYGTLGGATDVIFGHTTMSPVTISHGGHLATYLDSNGAIVSVKVSTGQLTTGDFSFDQQGELTLNLQRQEFTGADVSITGKDQLLTVNAINAQGVDLGNVSVGETFRHITAQGFLLKPGYKGGVLEEIEAGSGKFDATGKAVVGVKSLTLLALGNSTDDESHILESLGALVAKGEVSDLNAKGEVVTVRSALRGTLEIIGTGASILHTSIGSLEGRIQAEGNIGNVRIQHDLLSGSELSGIVAGGKLGLVKVGGSIIGDDANAPVIISALGNLGAKTAAGAVAIAGIRVAGDVTNAEFLAGYNAKLGGANPNASIGKVKVGGNWTASSVVAGVADTSTAGDLVSTPDGFGQHDSLIAGDTNGKLIARIASITIQGTATGSNVAGAFYGLTAEQIGAVSIDGEAFALTTGADDLDVNGNFRLVEIDA